MTFAYKPNIVPQHQRKDYIAAQVASASPSQPPYISHDVYEGKATTLPRVQLPLGMPLYRMANGRTQTQQLAYIAEKGVAADFFSQQQENETAQQVQHDILKVFASDGTDSITPIIDELARTKQTEPLLITQSGIVVNGNRRLAAMRELYTQRSAQFPSFAHVECAVLPALSDEEVDDVEIRLQMRPETKLPYTWIDEALKIQKLMSAGRKEDEIARLMNQSVTTVRKSISALKFAEIFLKDWKKAPRDYRLVHDGKQFFNDLIGLLKDKDGELLEATMKLAWVLFDNRKGLGSRIYDFNKLVGKQAADVLSRLSERIDTGTDTSDEVYPPGFAEDDLEVDFGDATPETQYGSIIAALDDPERREEVTDELKAVCQTIVDAGRTAKEGQSARAAVQDANTRLTEVDLTKADPDTYDAIDKQLIEIIHRASELKTKLEEYKTKPAPAAANGT